MPDMSSVCKYVVAVVLCAVQSVRMSCYLSVDSDLGLVMTKTRAFAFLHHVTYMGTLGFA